MQTHTDQQAGIIFSGGTTEVSAKPP